MPILPNVISDVKQAIYQILDAVNGKLTFEENLFVYEATVADSGTADSVNTVAHSLGFIPSGYIANIDRAGSVYDYNRSSWTASQIQVKCSVANAQLTLTIF